MRCARLRGTQWLMDRNWLEQYVEDYNNRVYNGLMSPNAKRLLREMKRREYEEYLLEESRIDNNTGHDDQ